MYWYFLFPSPFPNPSPPSRLSLYKLWSAKYKCRHVCVYLVISGEGGEGGKGWGLVFCESKSPFFSLQGLESLTSSILILLWHKEHSFQFVYLGRVKPITSRNYSEIQNENTIIFKGHLAKSDFICLLADIKKPNSKILNWVKLYQFTYSSSTQQCIYTL